MVSPAEVRTESSSRSCNPLPTGRTTARAFSPGRWHGMQSLTPRSRLFLHLRFRRREVIDELRVGAFEFGDGLGPQLAEARGVLGLRGQVGQLLRVRFEIVELLG